MSDEDLEDLQRGKSFKWEFYDDKLQDYVDVKIIKGDENGD